MNYANASSVPAPNHFISDFEASIVVGFAVNISQQTLSVEDNPQLERL